MNVVVLVSGGGTNLQSLIDYEKSAADCPYKIVAVCSNTKNAFALERAKKASIPAFVKSPFSVMGKEAAQNASREEKNAAVSDAVLEVCKEFRADLIVLAGYLSVLRGKIISEYEGKIINLHPALLPKFGGVGMWGENVHRAVLDSGEKRKRLYRPFRRRRLRHRKNHPPKKVPVLPGDTVETLYARIAPKEHEAIVEAVLTLCK